MGKSINVLSPGTGCFIRLPGDKDSVPGTILAAQIGIGGIVQYEVVWWDGSTRLIEWLHAQEVDTENSFDQCQIGFYAEKRSEIGEE